MLSLYTLLCMPLSAQHRACHAYRDSVLCRACRMGESRAGLEGLILLLKRIRLVAERNTASPAERLLDDALRLLDMSTGHADAGEYEEVSGPHMLLCGGAEACSQRAPGVFLQACMLGHSTPGVAHVYHLVAAARMCIAGQVNAFGITDAAVGGPVSAAECLPAPGQQGFGACGCVCSRSPACSRQAPRHLSWGARNTGRHVVVARNAALREGLWHWAEEELGEESGADEEEVERVSQAEFLALAESMLARARAQQSAAQQALQTG